MITKEAAEELSEYVEQASNVVAAFTGIKQQFVDAGWHERAAEQMVHAMFAHGAGGEK